MSAGKEYPDELSEGSSHAHALELVRRSGAAGGVVLDLGCGNAPAAEPLRDAGFEYVGADVDRSSLARLEARGLETARLDLSVSGKRLTENLRKIIGDRTLSVVLALDVLEHLIDPGAVLDAVRAVAAEHTGCSLVVSIPNVTHVDVASRLLIGKWQMTAVGLLDDTHVQFFSAGRFDELFREHLWREVDAHDTIAEFSDQFVLERTPAIQPGAGLGNLLRRVRREAAPHSDTYQFVRRFEPAEAAVHVPAAPDAAAPLVTFVVHGDGEDDEPLRRDLDQQSDGDFEIVRCRSAHDALDAAVAEARGRYLVFVSAGDRVGPRLVETVRRAGADLAPGAKADCVVRVDAGVLSRDELDRARAESFDVVAERADQVTLDGFDPLSPMPDRTTVLAAYAVPRSACTTTGVRFDPALGEATTTGFVARAVELCTKRDIGDLQVVVDESNARPAAADVIALSDVLGTQSFVLPPGGLARAFAHQLEYEEARRRADELRHELEEARGELQAVEVERERLARELQAIVESRTWHYAQLGGRAYRWARRLIGR